MIYMVEHGFSDPNLEPAWNEWYTDHATYAFRSVPGWRTGQRFIAIPPSQPKYRAMYTLENAEVLTSDAYKATTGGRFPETWRSVITDFHRNLADGDWMPAVKSDERLVVFDPPATGQELPGVNLTTWNIVGLEKTIPQRSIAIVDRASGESIAKRALPGISAYTPVFDRWMI